MKDYPQLARMGIHNPEQIENYMVNGIATYDVLRVVHARKKGSLLPSSRSYKFPRIQREIPATGSDDETTTVMETSPSLRSAVAELKDLLDAKTKKQNLKNVLLEEITLLEEDIALRSKYIKALAERL